LSIKHLQFLTNRITLERFHNLPAPQQQQVPVAGGRLRPGAPPGELNETSSVMAHSLHYVKHDVIHKTGSTQRVALPSEEV